MESAFGMVFDVVQLPAKTREQIITIRNNYIEKGEKTFTSNDVLIRAVDALTQIESFGSKVKKGTENGTERQRSRTPERQRPVESGSDKLPPGKKL